MSDVIARGLALSALKRVIGAESNISDLNDAVAELRSIGKFLSAWDCTTGLPETDPVEMPYTYLTGDYYIISATAEEGGTNYKPNGSTYSGAASTTIETEIVADRDFYFFDGTNWFLLKNTAGSNAVLYSEQSGKTQAEKMQARKNIGLDINAKTSDMTQDVGLGTDGRLYTKQGAGLPAISSSIPADGVLKNNVQYEIGGYSSITISGFEAAPTGYAGYWSVVFTAGNNFNINLPDSVVWAVESPVFVSGRNYWIQFTKVGSSYIAVWSAWGG